MRKKPWEGPLLWCKTVLSALKACFQSEHIVNIPRISTGRSLWLQQQISVQVRLSSNARVSLGHNLVYGKYKTSRHSQRIVRLILWYHYLRIKHNCVFFFFEKCTYLLPWHGLEEGWSQCWPLQPGWQWQTGPRAASGSQIPCRQ